MKFGGIIMTTKNTKETKIYQVNFLDDRKVAEQDNGSGLEEGNMSKIVDLNEELFELQKKLAEENHENGEGPDYSFLSRIEDIVTRFETIMRLTPVIEVTENELMILGEVICGSYITPRIIGNMHERLMDSSIGDLEERIELRSKIMKLSAAERIAFIESLNL
jgi:hypothetical protein